ncbi:hypothetical protein NL676_033089 [Syzygium grande]|nr:hypothetical protein NL676_033089 [Syzygium grande]
MSRSLGIPVKLLHEASGHIVTVELKSGELYRGSMLECEDNWNCQLENITYTAKDGKVSQLEHVFIRGSKVRFMVIPDMLKNAPMFKRLESRIKGKSSALGVGRGRAVAMRARAQAAGRGAPPGRGVVPPVRSLICCILHHHRGHCRQDHFSSNKTLAITNLKLPSTSVSSAYTMQPKPSHRAFEVPETKDKCKHSLMLRFGRHSRRRNSSADFRYNPMSYAWNFDDKSMNSSP